MSSIQTTTHSYPREEINAMNDFYGGKTCVVTRRSGLPIQWAHMLNAALPSSNTRLQWMLDRNLRQDRHPTHAAEVRENVIPSPLVEATVHLMFDGLPAEATLFLHEDLLARTLAFELELQEWRRMELKAGRSDPGRPPYQDAFKVFAVTTHRFHAASESGFIRSELAYPPSACPGVYPDATNPFPVIPTLLSIPFSLLHTLPRLASMVPANQYWRDLVTMGEYIIALWSWDPSPEEIQESYAIAATSLEQSPRPHSIDHLSRQGTTFTTMRPHMTFGVNNTVHHLIPGPYQNTYELSSGEVLVHAAPLVAWEIGEGLQLTAESDELPMMGSKNWQELNVDELFASVLGDQSSDSEVIHNSDKPLEQIPSYSNVVDWLSHVDGCDVMAPSPSPAAFEKGVIGSMSVNDVLMVRGLIDPGVYIQYRDLSSFP